MASHSIAYDLTDAQLAEMLLALDHHRGTALIYFQAVLTAEQVMNIYRLQKAALAL
jgi:hypothetical protein